MRFRVLFLLIFVTVLSSCKTSSELRHGSGEEDPAGIKTVENPVHAVDPNRRPEDWQREIDVLNGRLEEQQYIADQERDSLLETIARLQIENDQLREKMGLRALERNSPKASKPSQVSSKKVGGSKGAKLLWSKALNDIESENFDSAVTLLDDFVKTYPKDKGVYWAYLGLAMALYQSGEYQSSAIHFNHLIDKFPKHKLGALPWFGQGVAFAKMKQKQDSDLFFQEVVRRFPKSTTAKKAKRALRSKKVPGNLFSELPYWKKWNPF